MWGNLEGVPGNRSNMTRKSRKKGKSKATKLYQNSGPPLTSTVAPSIGLEPKARDPDIYLSKSSQEQSALGRLIRIFSIIRMLSDLMLHGPEAFHKVVDGIKNLINV
jgi:hypothetical protein